MHVSAADALTLYQWSRHAHVVFSLTYSDTPTCLSCPCIYIAGVVLSVAAALTLSQRVSHIFSLTFPFQSDPTFIGMHACDHHAGSEYASARTCVRPCLHAGVKSSPTKRSLETSGLIQLLEHMCGPISNSYNS